MDDLLSHAYELLKLPEDASKEDVERAYRTLVDRGKKERERWDEVKEIDAAFQLLMEHLCRRAEAQTAQSSDTVLHGDSLRPIEEYPSRSFNLKELLFPSEEKVSPASFWGRLLFYCVMLFWGVMFILAPLQGDYLGQSFMHLINLPFHEAGHLVFAVLGDFMRVLGGTLMQILVPLVCVAAFVKKGDPFGASFALWWAGQSFIDAAPYIYDARAGELMLLGGVTGQDAPDFHDWHNILERLSMLAYDHGIAYLSKYTGVFLILASFAWGGYSLFSQYRTLKKAKRTLGNRKQDHL